MKVAMSALGHKRTCAAQNGMSALPRIATAKADIGKPSGLLYPPKADICSAQAHVCFVPEADTRHSKNSSEAEEISDCLAPRHHVVIAELDKFANISWLKKQIAGEAPL